MHSGKQLFGKEVYLSGHNINLPPTSSYAVSIEDTIWQKTFKSQIIWPLHNIQLTFSCLHSRTHNAEPGFDKWPSSLENKAAQLQTATSTASQSYVKLISLPTFSNHIHASPTEYCGEISTHTS